MHSHKDMLTLNFQSNSDWSRLSFSQKKDSIAWRKIAPKLAEALRKGKFPLTISIGTPEELSKKQIEEFKALGLELRGPGRKATIGELKSADHFAEISQRDDVLFIDFEKY